MNSTFGTVIRNRRKEWGLSLRNLADLVGISYTYLSKIERGVLLPPSEGVIIEMASALELDPDEVLALADKVKSDIHYIIVSNPWIAQVLRTFRDEGPAKAAEMLQSIKPE